MNSCQLQAATSRDLPLLRWLHFMNAVNGAHLKSISIRLQRKLQDIKQENKTVEECTEQVQEMVTEGYPDAPENVIDTIATDTFLKGIENKRAAFTAMDKDPTTLENALQLVKGAINNQKIIYGGRKPEVRKVRFNDAYSDSNEETEFSSRTVRPQTRVDDKLAAEVETLKLGLEAVNTKIDKLIGLISNRSRSPQRTTAQPISSSLLKEISCCWGKRTLCKGL